MATAAVITTSKGLRIAGTQCLTFKQLVRRTWLSAPALHDIPIVDIVVHQSVVMVVECAARLRHHGVACRPIAQDGS